jgi:hypothetical protein
VVRAMERQLLAKTIIFAKKQYCCKKVSREYFKYSRPGSVGDIPAGEGKIANLFLQCT